MHKRIESGPIATLVSRQLLLWQVKVAIVFQYIYLLGVFTENLYSDLLERNVVYIRITKLSHAA